MKPYFKSLFAMSVLGLFGCGGSGDGNNSAIEKPNEVIDNIAINEAFYPALFRDSLQDNMAYFLDGVGVSNTAKVPYDHVLTNGDLITPASYANVATLGLYINLLVEMAEHGDEDAILRLATVLSQLESAPHWNGLFYWLYDIESGELKINQDSLVSAVDNGIVSFSLAALNGAFMHHSDERLNQIAVRAQALIERQIPGWLALYDQDKGLLRAGWSRQTGDFLTYHIDRKANESRLATLWAVMVTGGAIPESAFFDMTLMTVSHLMNGESLTPMLTWDGSYFQALLPALWLDEAALMPDYQMVRDFTAVHKSYADSLGIPFVSASATITNGYSAYGLEAVSESYLKYGNSIHTGTTGSPHTLGLYYLLDPIDSVNRLNELKAANPQIETRAGWADAIDTNGAVSTKVIGLDQGMFVGAFFASSTRENVNQYLAYHGFSPTLISLYTQFVANEHLTATD